MADFFLSNLFKDQRVISKLSNILVKKSKKCNFSVALSLSSLNSAVLLATGVWTPQCRILILRFRKYRGVNFKFEYRYIVAS